MWFPNVPDLAFHPGSGPPTWVTETQSNYKGRSWDEQKIWKTGGPPAEAAERARGLAAPRWGLRGCHLRAPGHSRLGVPIPA